MGTHPIFESDFDCLTESKMLAKLARSGIRQFSRTSVCAKEVFVRDALNMAMDEEMERDSGVCSWAKKWLSTTAPTKCHVVSGENTAISASSIPQLPRWVLLAWLWELLLVVVG